MHAAQTAAAPPESPAPAPVPPSADATAPAPRSPAAAPPAVEGAVVTARPRHAKGDPLERLNRKLYSFHQRADHAVFRPIALFYKHVVPKFLRTAMRHIISNLTEPLVFMNDVLQLKPKRAARTLSRFVINSTVGVGGIGDVAKTAGLPHHDNSLGDTLARYGVGPGPYIFIPFFGPTTLRDLLGGQVENLLYPVAIGMPFDRGDYQLSSGLVAGLDLRAESDADFKALLDGAADPYATLRSVYLQARQGEIDDIKGAKPKDSFDDPLADPEAGLKPGPLTPTIDPNAPTTGAPPKDAAGATVPATGAPAPGEATPATAAPASPPAPGDAASASTAPAQDQASTPAPTTPSPPDAPKALD
ncbi:MlaA family lipoprotein [Sphingomonas sp. GlSt437]|uniref:MlaA family lipoprotein n=1 Tax=Sphingomonas sp. GlSt437 TaxID=3389970 RepID=UPI003EBD2D81